MTICLLLLFSFSIPHLYVQIHYSLILWNSLFMYLMTFLNSLFFKISSQVMFSVSFISHTSDRQPLSSRALSRTKNNAPSEAFLNAQRTRSLHSTRSCDLCLRNCSLWLITPAQVWSYTYPCQFFSTSFKICHILNSNLVLHHDFSFSNVAIFCENIYLLYILSSNWLKKIEPNTLQNSTQHILPFFLTMNP